MHMPETITTTCPLCGADTEVKWRSDCSNNYDYNPNFNPVREWRYCAVCNHIHAGNYPEQLTEAIKGHIDEQYLAPDPQLYCLCSDVLNNMDCGEDMSILDVGFGGGEMLLVANEMGLTCVGVDIRDEYVENLRRLLPDALLAKRLDDAFAKYDIIILGDILEHVEYTKTFLDIVMLSLADTGKLWISTPNFDSAFAKSAGVMDGMRGVCEHINWFSRESLDKLLGMVGLESISYRTSRHFQGCQERVCVRGSA